MLQALCNTIIEDNEHPEVLIVLATCAHGLHATLLLLQDGLQEGGLKAVDNVRAGHVLLPLDVGTCACEHKDHGVPFVEAVELPFESFALPRAALAVVDLGKIRAGESHGRPLDVEGLALGGVHRQQRLCSRVEVVTVGRWGPPNLAPGNLQLLVVYVVLQHRDQVPPIHGFVVIGHQQVVEGRALKEEALFCLFGILEARVVVIINTIVLFVFTLDTKRLLKETGHIVMCETSYWGIRSAKASSSSGRPTGVIATTASVTGASLRTPREHAR